MIEYLLLATKPSLSLPMWCFEGSYEVYKLLCNSCDDVSDMLYRIGAELTSLPDAV